jgi:hypothetical protein
VEGDAGVRDVYNGNLLLDDLPEFLATGEARLSPQDRGYGPDDVSLHRRLVDEAAPDLLQVSDLIEGG